MNLEEVMETIKQCWEETIEFFGEDFPFEEPLKFSIKDNGIEYIGIIEDGQIKLIKGGIENG